MNAATSHALTGDPFSNLGAKTMKTRSPLTHHAGRATRPISTLCICLAATLLSAAPALAAPSVTPTSVCPPLARTLLQAETPAPALGERPLPAIAIGWSTDTALVTAHLRMEIPAQTHFAGILAGPATGRQWRDVGGTWWDFATTPPTSLSDVAAVRFALGDLAAGESGTAQVALEPVSTTVELIGIEAWLDADGDDYVGSTGLRTNSCPMALQAFKCFGEADANGTCFNTNQGLPNWTFELADDNGDPLSPPAPTSPATGADGVTVLPVHVDATFLNGDLGDVVNDSYPLAGYVYTVTEVLPPTSTGGPVWSASPPSTLAKSIAVPDFQETTILEYANTCTCPDDDSVCTSNDCLPGPDGLGLCEYAPLPAGTFCDIADACAESTCDGNGVCQGADEVCDVMTFFGVLENPDGTLNSFRCEIQTLAGTEQVACQVAGSAQYQTSGELVLGPPECVPFVNQLPTLDPTTFVVQHQVATDLQLQPSDPDGHVVETGGDGTLPAGWTLLVDGTLSVPAGAPLGDYVINILLDDGYDVATVVITVRVLPTRLVFVTSPSTALVAADLAAQGTGSAIVNADAVCGAAAALGTTDVQSRSFVAWLSDSAAASPVHAKDRVADAVYVQPDGTVIAYGKADLLDGDLASGIFVMADGQAVATDKGVWTGTNRDGTASGNDCAGWSSTSDALTPTIGVPAWNVGDERWTENLVNFHCNRTALLYCFEP